MELSAESNWPVWQLLTKKFGRRPYFAFAPVIEDELTGVLVKSNIYKVLAMVLVFSIFFPAVAFFFWHLDRRHPVAYFMMFGSLLTAFMGLYTLLRRRQILFDLHSKEVCISYGVFPFTRHMSLPAEDIEVQLLVGQSNSPGNKTFRMFIVFCPLQPGPVVMCLVSSANQTALLPTYERLSQLLSGQAIDESTVSLESEDGRVLEVSTAPMPGTFMSRFRTSGLIFRTPDVAVIGLNTRAKLVFCLFVLVGFSSLTLLLSSVPSQFWHKNLLAIALPTAAIIVGLCGLLGKLGIRSSVFDRQRGQMTCSGQPSNIFSLAAGTRLDDIAVLQICMCSNPRHSGKADDSHISYQLNVVLSDPPGHRINLMDHPDKSKVTGDAGRLAEFLNVPLFDCT